MFALPLLLTMIPPVAQADLFVGTYTSPDGSKGIYRAQLNTTTGELSTPALVAETTGPSFLALHPNGKFLYSVNESSKGEVSAYAMEGGGLRFLNTEKFDGLNPCHLTVDPSGKNLLVAAYSGGTLTSLPIKPDGSLGMFSSLFQNRGSGPNKSRQEKPHMHSVYTDAKGKFAFACDLGTDEVLRFEYNSVTGSFSNKHAFKVPSGGGPRHLALHPSKNLVYVNNEMTLGVTTFGWDSKTGNMVRLQTISTVPAGTPVEGNSTAEIALHPTGKWLYVSNRGHDSIAVFAVQTNGTLKLVEIAAAGVKTPRGFGLDPKGQWLVVGGQNSNDLTSLRIDAKTGKLTQSGHVVSVSKPVCVLFTKP